MLERFLQVVPSRMGREGVAEESQIKSTGEHREKKKAQFHSVKLTAQAITALGRIVKEVAISQKTLLLVSPYSHRNFVKKRVQITEGNC